MAFDRLRPHKVRRPRRVLFDSSFLIAVMEHPTPWQEALLDKVGSFEGVVLQPVYSELERLARRRGRESGFARLALGLVDSGTIRLERSGVGRADDELVSQALLDGAIVATIDGELIRQLEASRVEVLSLSAGRVEIRRS